jgi:hypothetical protein
MSISTSVHDLKTLVLSFHSVIVIETVEEDRITNLLRSVGDQLWLPLFEWTVTLGLMRCSDDETIATTTDPLRLLRHLQGLTAEGLFLLKDFARHLDDAKVARQFRETAQSFSRGRSTMVLTGAPIHLPADIESDVVRYELTLPDRDELLKVVYAVIQSLKTTRKVVTQLREQDREQLLLALQGLTLNQARQAVAEVMMNAEGRTTEEDIQVVMKRKARLIQEGGLLEYYPVEDNRFQLGGFANLKAWLERQRIGFTPEARALNLSPPRGLLIVGVPGCGKSLAAKVIAREWKLPLVKLDAGRLFDKYIGESEKNFRKAIAMAESMAPVVLWIDEIEKGMVATGGSEADGGLSRRLFGAFLTWLQEKRQEVFVVATANDLSILPPELLRKGRFDEIFFVDLPDPQERETILKIHLTLRKQNPAVFDLAKIVASCDGFSGAEIEQAVVAGLYRALSAKRALDTDLLLEEISHTIPLSVTRREDIDRLREMARNRFVSVK